MEETPYWLGFHLVPGIGATRLARLIEHFGSLAVAWKASLPELRASGLNQRAAEAVLTTRGRISLDAELERVHRAGVEIVTLADDTYPRLLREISSPPPVLYVRGSLGEEDAPTVGVVGTRRATSYGREMTRRLCAGLAQAGVTIVSGLARGIDGVAHTTALESGARTIAVLGCGLDTIYPPEHRGLAERIITQGALVSEFPLGTRPDAGNFPIRNRLISGLSLGVIVVEAPRKSGALITSNFAAEQGRTVFAVPGSALAATSEGPLQLLQDGAVLATDPDDVLSDLNLGTRQVEMEIRRALPATGDERDVLGLLNAEPRHVDELALELGMHISRLSALLLQMQLKGFIRDAGAHHYVRA